MRNFTSFLLIKLFILFNIALQAQWTQTPGFVRDRVTAFGVSGTELFIGTERSLIFLSTDNGASWMGADENFTWAPVSAFAMSGDYIIAAADSGSGIFRSGDNGKTWEFAGTGLTSTRVSSLALKGTNLFAGTRGGGIFISNDNGSNWTQVNHGLTNPVVRCLAVSGDNVFAGTFEGGIFVSSDNGANWTQVNNGLANTRILSLLARGTDLFTGTMGGGVFRTGDNGLHWTQINSGLTDNTIFALAAIGPNLFAGTAANGVCLSTDNGDSWTSINTGLPAYTSVTAFGALGINLFMASYTGKIFRTSDFGANWNEISSGLTTNFATSLAISGPNIFAGTDTAGVFLSTNNGMKWTKVNNGLTNKKITCLAIKGTDIFAGTDSGGVFRSKDNGNIWGAVNNGLSDHIIKSIFVNGSDLYAGTLLSGAFLSTNNGTNWSPINNGMADQSVGAFAVIGPYLFAGSFGAVYRSSDNGVNWTRLSNGLEREMVTSLAALDTVLFAGLDMGGGIFKTTDYGENWTFLRGGFVYAFSQTGNNLFAGTASSDVLYSGDKGASWTAINEGFPENNYIYSLALNETYLFAGTFLNGVWRRPLSELITLPPGSPKLVSVPDKSKDQPVDLTLSWSGVPTADTYRLQVSTDSHFGSLVLDDAAITGTSKNVKKLKYNTTYYWRVSAKNSGGESPWSEVWKFTTLKGAPAVPRLFKPANNASEVKENMHCIWGTVQMAELYRICLAEDKKFKDLVFCDSLKDTLRAIKGLKQGARYFWRVMAISKDGSSEFSEAWSFTVILYPPEGLKLQVLSKNRVRFSWTAVPNESAKYIIERRQFKEKDFKRLDTTKAGVTSYIDTTVKSAAEYYYRLKAFTPYAESDYSEQVKTSIIEIASIESVPLSYSLLQNYPNPFNPATVIQYELPEESSVSLSVYDMLGKLAGRLISSVQPAGKYSIQYNAGSLPSGIYVYIIEARSLSSSKSFNTARKMILLR